MQFVFKDVIMTTSPVAFVLCEMITDILTKSDESQRITIQVEAADVEKYRKRSSRAISNENATTYNSRMSIFGQQGAPMFYEILQFMWFFYDIILKSILLNSSEIKDGGYKFFNVVKDMIRSIAEKVRYYRD